MRILIVTQYFWPEGFVINGLATELQMRHHEVSVLTGLPNYPNGKILAGYSVLKGPWTEDYFGVKVYRVPLLSRGMGFLRLSLNYLSFVISGCVFSLFHPVKKNDIIFCFALSPITSCLPGMLLSWLTGKKLVIWVQDLWPESVQAVGAVKSDFFLNLIGRLVRFIYQKCDVIFVQSKAFTESVVKWGGDPAKIIYLPNWADPFPAVAQNPSWVDDLPSGFLISFAGNIGKAQDMKTLLDAAELLKGSPEIKWIIAGDGSEKKWLDAEIERRHLQGHVITVGKKPYSDMYSFFKKSNAMLVLLTDEPIFSLTVPSKVQAYMAAGRPIVGSIRGEGARMLDGAQAGLTCDPQSPQRLAEAVLKMKEFPEPERVRMGVNGQNYFNAHFDRKIVIDQIETVFKSLLGDQKIK